MSSRNNGDRLLLRAAWAGAFAEEPSRRRAACPLLCAALSVLLLCLSSCSCGPKPCSEGEAGCACRAGNTCDDGLACGSDGKCGAVEVRGVHVSDAAARGCEVVLGEQAGTTVTGVVFKNGLKGAFVREAPRVAVTFVAGGDQAIAAGSVEVRLSGSAPSVTLASGSCVDSKGARLGGAPVSVR